MTGLTAGIAAAVGLLLLAGCTGDGGKNGTLSSPPPAVAITSPVGGVSPVGSPVSSSTPTAAASPTLTSTPTPSSMPKPTNAGTASDKPAVFPHIPVDHIVIVVEENHAYSQIIGSDKAPYLQKLVAQGALMTNAHGIAHPSQPNYLALFSGGTQGVKDDSCKGPFTAANLSTRLQDVKLSFAGYSEDLPKVGFTGCSAKGYARKHNPWTQFTNVSADANQPMTAFPSDYAKLPTVSFVIPSVENDMHDGSIEDADKWLQDHLGGYVDWADKHRSMLIVTWDEDDFAKANHIPLLLVGPMVKPGRYEENVNHYHVLRTIEDLLGMAPLGESKGVEPIKDIWK